ATAIRHAHELTELCEISSLHLLLRAAGEDVADVVALQQGASERDAVCLVDLDHVLLTLADLGVGAAPLALVVGPAHHRGQPGEGRAAGVVRAVAAAGG